MKDEEKPRRPRDIISRNVSPRRNYLPRQPHLPLVKADDQPPQEKRGPGWGVHQQHEP
jgi:hypothetical protein